MDIKEHIYNSSILTWDAVIESNYFEGLPKSFQRDKKIKFQCEICKKETLLSIGALRDRFNNNHYEKLCRGCHELLYHPRKMMPKELAFYYKNDKPISYDLFLHYQQKIKTTDMKVKIKCQYCHQEKIVTTGMLIKRKKRKFEQICSDCQISTDRLTGIYNDVHFESSYELFFLYACFKNGLMPKRCDIVIPYKIKDHDYLFYPDFIIDNVIFEIKGKESIGSKAKQAAAHLYCMNKNLHFCNVTGDILKIISDINIDDISIAKRMNNVQIFNYPSTSFFKNKKSDIENFNYLGYIYKVVDLKNSKSYIRYAWGKFNEQDIDMGIYYHTEVQYFFDSFCTLKSRFFELKEIYKDDYTNPNEIIPHFINHILEHHYDRKSYAKTKEWKNLNDLQKEQLIDKSKKEFHDLFTIKKGNTIINLLDIDLQKRINIVKLLNSNDNTYEYPQTTIQLIKRSRKFRYLFANKNTHRTPTKIYNHDNLLQIYEYEMDLYNNFDKDTFTFHGFENESFIKIECYKRSDSKNVTFIIFDDKRTIVINTQRILYSLFGITSNMMVHMLEDNVSYNGFFLQKREE